MPHYKEALASLLINDNIVVISSSHALSDGVCMVSALSKCLDDFSSEKVNKNAPLFSSDGFKEEGDEAEKKFDVKNIWPMEKFTICKYDTNNAHLAPLRTQYIDKEHYTPVDQLACYNKKAKNPKDLSDFSRVGVLMLILALNQIINNVSFNYNEPLSITTILDIKRFASNKSKINWTYGNCIAQLTIKNLEIISIFSNRMAFFIQQNI